MKFKQILLSTLVFFTSSAFAQTKDQEPNPSHAQKLVPGKEVELNVANVENVVFKLEVPHAKGSAAALPTASIVSTYGGFECEVLSVSLKSTKATKNDNAVSTFEISVDWFPGADASGCFVEVNSAGLAPSHARVFMSF